MQSNHRWPLIKTLKIAGTYTLTTNYAGGANIVVPDTVHFLAPIELIAPDLQAKPDLNAALQIKWKPVDGAQAYHIAIFGIQGGNVLIMWDSAEQKNDIALRWDNLNADQIAAQLKAKALLSSDQTAITVPAGIFKDCDAVFVSLIGYGAGTVQADGQPQANVQAITSMNLLLGVKDAQDAKQQAAPAAGANQQAAPAADANQQQAAPAADANQQQAAPAADANQQQAAPAADANQQQAAPAADANQQQAAPAADANQQKGDAKPAN